IYKLRPGIGTAVIKPMSSGTLLRQCRLSASTGTLSRDWRMKAFSSGVRNRNGNIDSRAQAMTRRVLITTSPFGELDPQALRLLEQEKIGYTMNPLGRRLREEELTELIGPYEVMIAGTEPITKAVLERAPALRLIAHTGIGLDNIQLAAARERGIALTYTPSAPSPAVAEMTIGQMLALLRKTA